MPKTKGLFKKIVFIIIAVVIGTIFFARSPTCMDWLEEYYPVITMAITIIFLMALILRWKHKDIS